MRYTVALAIAIAGACRPPSSGVLPPVSIERRSSELAAALDACGVAVDLAELRVEQRAGEAWVERVGAELDRTHRPAYWEAMAALRQALAIGSAAAGAALRERVARARARARRAVYDAERATIVVAADALGDPRLDRDLARALVRAYQHQRRLDARVRPAGAPATTDATTVRSCVLDGHADLLALALANGRPPSALDDVWFGPIGTPVAGEVEVTCAAGGRAVAAAARDGGWPAALRLLATPPSSTEQLLHPDKRGVDEPVAVALPPWPAEAGAAELILDDTLGELVIARLLRERGVGRRTAWRAAIGWDGDRLRAYASARTGPVIVWRSAWDREADARQFARALAGSHLHVVRAGRLVDAVACADASTRQLLVRALASAREPTAPSSSVDERTTRAAERVGAIVD